MRTFENIRNELKKMDVLSDVILNVDVFIEISKNSHIKYEYDKERKALICDRILHTPLNYHFNYGFIPLKNSKV